MHVTFPATKGVQSGKEFLSLTIQYRYLVKFFEVMDQNLSPSERSQRSVNTQRVNQIARYILDNKENYVLPPIVAIYDEKLIFSPIDPETEVGIVAVPLDIKLYLLDGQHRVNALRKVIEEDYTLGFESITVNLYYDHGLKMKQQYFHDINHYAKSTPASLNFLYNHRDKRREQILEFMSKIEMFSEKYVEMEKGSVTRSSSKLFSLKQIEKAHRKIDAYYFPKYIEFWNLFYTAVLKPLLETLSIKEIKSKLLITHAVMIEAIVLYVDRTPIYVEGMIEQMKLVDWSRPAWENVIIFGRQVKKSKAVIEDASYHFETFV